MTNEKIIEKVKEWLQNNVEHMEFSNAARDDSKLLLEYIEKLQGEKNA